MSTEIENNFSHDDLNDYYENQKSQRILDQLEADEEKERYCNLVSLLEERKVSREEILFSGSSSIQNSVLDHFEYYQPELNNIYVPDNQVVSPNNDNFFVETPNYEDILPNLYDHKLKDNKLIKSGSDSKIDQLENNSVQQLKLLKDFKCEVVESINEIKNKLILAEANYIKFLQQVESKRIILDKDQNLQLRNIQLLEERLSENEEYNQFDLNEEEKYIKEEKQKLFNIREARMHIEDCLLDCENDEKAELEKQLTMNQEAEDNQCFILDNIEFQILERKTQKEEEDDENIKQNNDILRECEELQLKIMNILSKKSEMSKSVSKECSELRIHQEHLSHLLHEEELVLENINKQIAIQERFYQQNINKLKKKKVPTATLH